MEGERIFELVIAYSLVVSTYQSGENQSQINYILVKQQNINLVHDVKVIPNEECKPAQTTCLETRVVKSEDQ